MINSVDLGQINNHTVDPGWINDQQCQPGVDQQSTVSTQGGSTVNIQCREGQQSM